MMDTLVLDIGGDVGALVLVAGPELAEQEIEISAGRHTSIDAATPRSHNVVHARHGGGRVAYTAVFPSVPAGDYTVWRPDGSAHATVTIHGGRVTEHHLT
ncbi:MAG TPA: hypothetical protein VH969_30585 [Actinophytocola sp.]|jgi:hypothetical protein|uniref:hypothetical protein n=1 Tax=Actinophytocola sp. TaxID=1872138 RepID=UPI002F936057